MEHSCCQEYTKESEHHVLLPTLLLIFLVPPGKPFPLSVPWLPFPSLHLWNSYSNNCNEYLLKRAGKYFKLAPHCYHSGKPDLRYGFAGQLKPIAIQSLLASTVMELTVTGPKGRMADNLWFPEELDIQYSLELWDKCSVGGMQTILHSKVVRQPPSHSVLLCFGVWTFCLSVKLL